MNQTDPADQLGSWKKGFFKSKSYYVLYIPLVIFIFKAISAILAIIQNYLILNNIHLLDNLYLFSNDETATFFGDFIEWFGVLYGFLLPLILVRVWEQFDDIDREFDKEADSVKILSENIRLLHDDNKELGDTIIKSLIKYAEHVKNKYSFEAGDTAIRVDGDKILKETRELFKELIHPVGKKKKKEPDSLISELIEQLDNIIDTRGDRISLSSERLFDVLRSIGLVTSVIFLLPFYYVGFTPKTGLMENILIVGITILVVLIYVILDDLDDPFGGIWKIKPDSWDRILEDINRESTESSTS